MSTPLSSFSNLEDAINEILTERRLELAYEGHRYIDLKRTRSITNDGIDRDGADCGGSIPCNLIATDYRFTFPIPVAELNANTNITQAPGY